MKRGDRLKIEIPGKPLPEKLRGIAGIRHIIKSTTVEALEGKELIFVRLSPVNKDWAIVKAPDGNEYEVCKEFLKEEV